MRHIWPNWQAGQFYLHWGKSAQSGGGGAETQCSLLTEVSKCSFPGMGAKCLGAVAGKDPQNLWACRNSVCCSCNKRETERSVAMSGSHAPGLLEMPPQSKNWRQMKVSCSGSLVPSSLKCCSNPENLGELEGKGHKENKSCLRCSVHIKAFLVAPLCIPGCTSVAQPFNQSISQSTNIAHLLRGCDCHCVRGIEPHAKQKLCP